MWDVACGISAGTKDTHSEKSECILPVHTNVLGHQISRMRAIRAFWESVCPMAFAVQSPVCADFSESLPGPTTANVSGANASAAADGLGALAVVCVCVCVCVRAHVTCMHI